MMKQAESELRYYYNCSSDIGYKRLKCTFTCTILWLAYLQYYREYVSSGSACLVEELDLWQSLAYHYCPEHQRHKYLESRSTVNRCKVIGKVWPTTDDESMVYETVIL